MTIFCSFYCHGFRMCGWLGGWLNTRVPFEVSLLGGWGGVESWTGKDGGQAF